MSTITCTNMNIDPSEASSSDEESHNSDLTVVDELEESESNDSISDFQINRKNVNAAILIRNRELYGRFTKSYKQNTERFFNYVTPQRTYYLSEILPLDEPNILQHVFMGLTICGRFMLSYITNCVSNELDQDILEYRLYIWKFSPGTKLTLAVQHRIFKCFKSSMHFDSGMRVSFYQWPTDINKVVTFGKDTFSAEEIFVTVVFLPTLKKCLTCLRSSQEEGNLSTLCLKHEIAADTVIACSSSNSESFPVFQLEYPDHIVINTGHNIQVLNVSFVDPVQMPLAIPLSLSCMEENFKSSQFNTQCFNDNMSEISECPSDFEAFVRPNVIESIIQDFSDCDFDTNECSKPFHELNISCEPLNVIGRSYYSSVTLEAKPKTLDTKIFPQPQPSTQKSFDKPKIDRVKAEKAYEFIEENEKCEKLSSFRKKRLADKKYEFSEDNSENIIPFNRLRYERVRAQLSRFTRTSDTSGQFLSPRPQTMRSPRSPMLSPGSRHSQFSPGGTRSMYSTRSSPSSCRSPISPRDQGRRFNVYSPCHSDNCSDYIDLPDSKLILRQFSGDRHGALPGGLLTVDGKRCVEFGKPKWTRTLVRRFCTLDFENHSLVSDAQNKDEPIELPSFVFTSSNVQLDAVPTRISDDVIGSHIRILQRSFDCEQFCHYLSERICSEKHLKFVFCEDYDIKILHVCPLSGDILCTGLIKIGAVEKLHEKQFHISFLFSWNIASNEYNLLGSNLSVKPVEFDCKPPELNCKKVRVMVHNFNKSVKCFEYEDSVVKIELDSKRFNSDFAREIFPGLEDFSDNESDD